MAMYLIRDINNSFVHRKLILNMTLFIMYAHVCNNFIINMAISITTIIIVNTTEHILYTGCIIRWLSFFFGYFYLFTLVHNQDPKRRKTNIHLMGNLEEQFQNRIQKFLFAIFETILLQFLRGVSKCYKTSENLVKCSSVLMLKHL